MKKLTLIALASASLAFASTAGAAMITFDANGITAAGEVAKTGAEIGTGGNNNGADVYGSSLTFSEFVVTAGRSTNRNLNGSLTTFRISNGHINERRVYQDLDLEHGGLGAVNMSNLNDDNLNANVGGNANNDEVLFFDFGADAVINRAYFNGGENGAHQALTDINGNSDDQHFHIFVSTDGDLYTEIFGVDQTPTGGEYIDTNVTDAYRYWAIASTGEAHSQGGHVEAIEFAVPAPGAIYLLAFGLLLSGTIRRRALRS